MFRARTGTTGLAAPVQEGLARERGQRIGQTSFNQEGTVSFDAVSLFTQESLNFHPDFFKRQTGDIR
jgi:hypothetical protein